MNRRHALKILAGAALCPLCAHKGMAEEHAHWSYEGDSGPAKWGDLDAADKVCAVGGQQSPIDITATIKSKLPPLRIKWPKRAETIVNNGHTIQLNFAEGNTLAVGKNAYRLVQLHFHRPSEHLVGGKNFPMEAHFVHRADSGAYAVVGVLMTTGRPNAAFKRIVSTMPAEEGPAVKADPAIDPHALLPGQRDYYRYEGSLTTPPCSETVDWLLLTTPVHVGEADVARFAKLYPMNARPAQKDNRRYVLQSE
jgi:carbonic anhydrase